MEENVKPDLFEIKINQTGVDYVRKLFRVSGIIYFLIIAASLLHLFLNVRSIVRNSNIQVTGWDAIRMKLIQYIWMVTIFGNLIAVLYYLKGIRLLNYGIQNDNEILFNRSFKYILRNAVFFIMIVILNLITTIISIV
jgi:hypothetical protein